LLVVIIVDNKQWIQSSACCMPRIASLAAGDDVGGRRMNDEQMTQT
jgi:hypothetical protein